MTGHHDSFLSDADLDSRWQRKHGYAAELRAKGRGPRHVRLSPRVVRYRLSDVIEYERRLTFSSNAEAMVASSGDPPEAA
jgi:hypothetical protein